MEYSDIINQLLNRVEDVAQVDDKWLLSQAREMGLDDNGIAGLEEAFSLIDRTTSQTASLDVFRKQSGGTRIGYISCELDKITAKMSDEEKQTVIEAYCKAVESAGALKMEEE